MALPFSPNTTYIAGSTPTIKAQDLNDLQTYLSGLYTGVYSVAGLRVDSVGTNTPVARQPTTALFRAEDGAGGARGLTDYLGFRTGPVFELADNFMGTQQKSGAQSGAFIGGNGGWYLYSTSAGSEDYLSALPYQGGSALPLSLSAARTSSDYISLYNQGVYNAWTAAAAPYNVLDQTVTVFEWAFTFSGSYTGVDWFSGVVAGLDGSITVDPTVVGSTPLRAGLRYAPSLGDTSLCFVSSSGGSSPAVVATGIAVPTNGALVRCRLEIHRTNTPLGLMCRLFVNGAPFTVTASGNLPIYSIAPLGCMFKTMFKSTATGAAVSMYLQYWKMFAMPFGKLTAGALTSDV
jgi:hypothetical protein